MRMRNERFVLQAMPERDSAGFDARRVVDELLEDAVRRQASDVHFEPMADGLEVRYPIDGLLQTGSTLPTAAGRSLVQRLMVMAQLLTYRTNVPQEGRATVIVPSHPQLMDLRVSIMPTTHGMRAAVRLPAELRSRGISISCSCRSTCLKG